MDSLVILTGTRTGSTEFYRTLDAHPSLEVYGEMFLGDAEMNDTYAKYLRDSPDNARRAAQDSEGSIDDYLTGLLQARRGGSMCGFKLIYDDMPPALEAVLSKRKPKIIHLVRRNALKRRVSQIAAHRRGVFHVKSDAEAPSGRIRIDVSTLLRELRARELRVEQGREFARRFEHLEVYYEDMVESRDAMFAPVFEFLGVPPAPLAPPAFQKINPDSLDDIVENYDEVVAALKGSEFERHLD